MSVKLHILATLLSLLFALLLAAAQINFFLGIFDTKGTIQTLIEFGKVLLLLPLFFAPWLILTYLVPTKCLNCGANSAMACGGRKIQYRCKICDHLYDTGARLSSNSRRRHL